MSDMNKSIALHGGLLLALLGGAWMSWTAEPGVDLDGKVLVMEGEAGDIEVISWKTEKDGAVIEIKEDGRGSYAWVTYTKQERKTLKHPEHGPDAAQEDGPDEAPTEEYETTTQVFKAGDKVDALVGDLSPLVALRKLVDVDEDKLAAIGLDAPTDSLIVTRAGKARSFDLGGEAYGTRDRYVRDQDSGHIYLVDDDVFRPLKYARTRLPDRTLTPFVKADVTAATLEDADGAVLEAVQLNPQDKAQAAWVRAADPEALDEQLQTWMDKALNLKSTSYAGPDSQPEALELRFKLTLSTGTATESIEVLQEEGGGGWWGRSAHTRGHVKLLRGQTSGLSEDVEGLIGG
jgi:hypothetical protein